MVRQGHRQLTESRFMSPRSSSVLLLALTVAALGGCGNSIHDLARWGKLDDVKAMLDRDPSLLEKPNDLGKTPLFFAVTFDQMDVAKLLVDRGANINAKDITGLTPLHVAAFMGHKDMVVFLLEKGVPIESLDNFGDTPLHVAAYKDRPEVFELLLSRGANIAAKNNEGLLPLQLAEKHLSPRSFERFGKFMK